MRFTALSMLISSDAALPMGAYVSIPLTRQPFSRWCKKWDCQIQPSSSVGKQNP